MSDRDDWTARVSGTNCPLCAPRPQSNDHWDLIAPLSVSSLYLAKNQTYRGQCQLIFDLRHAARLDQLTADEVAAFSRDLLAAHNAVARAARPDHMNVESLGNIVPHLHWHIIPRYVGDPQWGVPVWTNPLSSMPDRRLDEMEQASLIDAIRAALTGRRHALED
ncbi:MAG TPA: HIT family protein [Vicinamibacterales bacterium]|jgi:diadenosine tetraphosphate (Ap4A) HIT family hydrolase|nr:HIT family protein [Vicinamibacterales bacterium]